MLADKQQSEHIFPTFRSRCAPTVVDFVHKGSFGNSIPEKMEKFYFSSSNVPSIQPHCQKQASQLASLGFNYSI
ncbi:Uncharacterized protein TCM_000800 [Theobroma cacao]|uniref:Uncharacterized protein n=1 Tax=Theobroma cacao TaxID=3641 RepID=A0A061DH13_THECC|nr:Uncharacterized protein TCM_000800 [Theobroma cacao]